jgi:hypothetical protein
MGGGRRIIELVSRAGLRDPGIASRIVIAGVDLRTVAQLPGYRTLQVVMR